MNIPDELINKLLKDIDKFPLFLLKHTTVLQDNFDTVIEKTEDLSIILKFLKYKTILIYEKQAIKYEFNVNKLYEKVTKNNFTLLHEVLLYSLIIQPSFKTTISFLTSSHHILENNVKDMSKDDILHHLEIIDVILLICTLSKRNLMKESQINNLNLLLINLISLNEKDICKKITVDIIPKYITSTNDYDLFSKLWHEMFNTSIKLSTILALENYFIPQEYNELHYNILNVDEFWIYLQNNMCNSEPLFKKQVHYLFKKAIQTLLYNESYIKNFNFKCDIIQWNQNNLDAYRNSWKQFFILYDVSNEKQIHLIEPTFKLYDSLNLLHLSWRYNISKLFIFHPHSAVVKLTLVKILRKEWSCTMSNLLLALNNYFLYENISHSDFMHSLNLYIEALPENDRSLFIQEICNNITSPISLYHLCKCLALTNLKGVDLKDLIDLNYLQEKMPNLYIRKGIADYVFQCFLKITAGIDNMNKYVMNNFLKLIYLLHKCSYLQRGNLSWNKISDLILTNKHIYDYIISLNITGNFCLLSNEYSVFIVLLIDSKIIKLEWLQNYLTNIFNIKDYHTKLNNFTLLFTILNVMSIPDEIFQDTIFSDQVLENIFNELFDICNELGKYYTEEFFNNLEFIFFTIVNKTPFDKNNIELFLKFFANLKNTNKNVCYIMLCKVITDIYDLYKIQNKKELQKLLIDLKNLKNSYCSELKTSNAYSNLKQKIFFNYYYTKLNTKKILLETNTVHNDITLFEKINKYFDKGGSDIIISVVDILNVIINKCYFDKVPINFMIEYLSLLKRCEKEIFYLRSNNLFRPTISNFISTILHPQMFQYDILQEYTYNFCRNMFEPTQTITGIRNEILNRIRLQHLTPGIIVDGLLYGQVLRKDQRIEFETCNIIRQQIEHLNFDISNPYQLDVKVRSKSVLLLLSKIYNKDPNHHHFKEGIFCEDVLKILIDKYNKTAGKRYFGDSQTHLIKLRIFQTLHLIFPKLNNNFVHIIDWIFNCLVNESQQPSIKIFIQWLLVRIYNKFKNKEEIVHQLINQVENLKGTSCTSVFPLLFHIVKDKNINIKVVYECMEFLLPHTMGQQFNIRLGAQITMQHIYNIYVAIPEFNKKYESIYKTITNVLNQIAKDKINDSILPYYHLSPTVQMIYYDIPKITNVIYTEWIPVEYFNGSVYMKLRSDNEMINFELSIKNQNVSHKFHDESTNMNVQKKLESLSLNTMEELEMKKTSGNLIIVASLIEKVPNLGGISRTCEIFGVKKYVINNIQHTNNKEYQSLSMSSEKWVNTIEIKNENLSKYLLEMKKRNYKIIGAEQTSDCKRLDTYKFEKDTLLLLGNEKEGIPPNLIFLLDECIEIPQYGQIRSLNVHVAGALFIWEYTKQHK